MLSCVRLLQGSMPEWKKYLRARANVNIIQSKISSGDTDDHSKAVVVWRCIFALDVILRGIAQVFLCDNPISGLLILGLVRPPSLVWNGCM